MVEDLQSILGKEAVSNESNLEYSIGSAIRSAMAIGPKSDSPIEEERQQTPEAGRYKVIEAYNGVEITQGQDGSKPIYNVILPNLSADEWMELDTLKEQILNDPTLDITDGAWGGIRNKSFTEEIKEILGHKLETLAEDRIKIYTDILSKTIFGYGLLEFLLEDDLLEEIMVLGESRRVYVIQRIHGTCATNITFEDDEEVVSIINRIARDAGKKIDYQNPILDASLRDGSRVNATLRHVTPSGATLTIRKFASDPLSIIDLIKNGTLSPELAAWLWLVVDGLDIKPANIIISGGTSSGKTTTLNTLTNFIPEGDRVISIEDTLELQMHEHEHWIKMETRPSLSKDEIDIDMNACLTNTLRMRPDRIIVGEVRGPEAETLFAAMNTGHDGCLGTLHANDSKETVTRLTNPPMNVPMIMIPALDLIIIQNRFKHPSKGAIRRITEVTEVAGMEQGNVLMNKIFRYDIQKDQVVETGTPSRLLQDLSKKTGIGGKQVNEEIDERTELLIKLRKGNKRSSGEVFRAITDFNRRHP